MANLQCLPASNILPYQADVSGSGDNIPATNSIRIAFGTVPGGPYVNFTLAEVGNNTVGQTFNRTITDIAADTTYYYVVQELDNGGNVIDTSAAECSFTTTGYNPVCEVIDISPDTNPATAHVRITADNVPPHLFLSIKFSNTPGGPYTQTLISVPGDNTIGQTVEVMDWPLEGCRFYYFVADISEEDGFLYGPSLLANGDFEATLPGTPGPGWTTGYGYCSCAGGIYSGCGPGCTGGGYQVQQVAPGTGANAPGGNTSAVGPWFGVPPNGPSAPGTRSINVNVGQNPLQPIVDWANIPMTNGKTYKLTLDAAIINNPFGVAVKADGGAIVLAPITPPNFRQWTTTDTLITWPGTTGAHDIGLYSDSPVFGGNDHMFDNLILREQEDPSQSTECVIDAPFDVSCSGVSDITCTAANIHGFACGIFGGTFTAFEYWTCPADPNDPGGFHTTTPVFHNGTTSQELLEEVIVLEPNTSYCFRVVAWDENLDEYIATSNPTAECGAEDACCFTTPDCASWCGGFWDPENCVTVDPGNGEPYVNCWPAAIRDGFPGEAGVPAPPLDLPPPQADLICTEVTNLTDVSATINGTADPTDATHFYRLAFGTSPGTYTTFSANTPGNGGLVSLTENVAGLVTETPYWYAVQELDVDGTTVLETSSECSFVTLPD